MIVNICLMWMENQTLHAGKGKKICTSVFAQLAACDDLGKPLILTVTTYVTLHEKVQLGGINEVRTLGRAVRGGGG